MGLGLFIVQQIVQAHAGRIDVESTPRGTNFMVFIPIG
jgi:nitrogen-specific signal transduction histidine kinase